MSQLPTIRIRKGTDDFKIINVRDFDPAKHEALDAAPATTPVTAPAPEPESAPEPKPGDLMGPDHDAMSQDELRSEATALGLSYRANASASTLRALIREATG